MKRNSGTKVSNHRKTSVTCRTLLAVAVIVLPLGRVFGSNQQETQGTAKQEKAPAVEIAGASRQNAYFEHWDILPLAGNNLHASPPLLGEKDEVRGFTRELIRLQWRPGDPIDLYVIRPASAVKPPVVVFLYGYPSDTDRFRNDAYCQTVVKHGFAAVGFVSALTGHRYHDRPMKEWFVSELQESLGSSVHDVQMILNYLETRGDLDMSRVGMYGQGSGGTIAILSASTDARIKAVDVLDPWGDWPDWLAGSQLIPDEERASYLAPDFLRGVSVFDPVQWLPRFTSRPLRLQQTAFSEVTPPAARKRIQASLAPTAKTLIYENVEEYNEKAAQGGNIFVWLQGQLEAIK
jgi:cephalosporin-C deacetylase-like acetyl esterase